EAQALIFCGDFCAPFTLKMLADGFPGPIHAVFGNNDGDKLLLAKVATAAGNVTLHGQFAQLELDGARMAVTHYPEIGASLAASGQYDLVCHGHNHQYEVERVGPTLRLNPGEVMGRFGASTYALYDTETGNVQRHEA
ncbi:MAG: metallophosphoesterase family protein, partial [Anaerolineae bacterium]